MESLHFDDATTVLLHPIHPRPDGPITVMRIDRFIEIISSFRLVNHVKQCSVGTECPDYSESISLKKVKECAQQTSVKTFAVSCQTEAVNSKKLSGIVYPIQRATAPVTPAAPVPESRANATESRSNAYGSDTRSANARMTGSESDRKVMDVVSRYISILKFCLQLKDPGGRESMDIVKNFKNNVAKDFERKELWARALKSDAVISDSRRCNGSRHSEEKRPSSSHPRRESGTKRAISNTKHFEHSPSKKNRPSRSRSRDRHRSSGDESTHSYMRARELTESKDRSRYSSKSNNYFSKSSEKSRQRVATSTNERDVNREETRRADRHHRDLVDSRSDVRVITNVSAKCVTESRENVSTDLRKVGCIRNVKLSDPRVTKSGEDDFGGEYSLSPQRCDTDLKITIPGGFPSDTVYQQTAENVALPECRSMKVSESERGNSAVAISDLDNAQTTVVSHTADSNYRTPDSGVSAKLQAAASLPNKSLSTERVEDCRLSQASTSVSNAQKVTSDEVANMVDNVLKNFPYVKQPKRPSLKMVENFENTRQSPRDDAIEIHNDMNNKDEDLVQVSRKKSSPLELDRLNSSALGSNIRIEDCTLESRVETESPLRTRCELSLIETVNSGKSERAVEPGNFSDPSITPAANMTRNMPVDEDRRTITKENGSYDIELRNDDQITSSEVNAKSGASKTSNMKNKISEIRVESDQRVNPTSSVLPAMTKSAQDSTSSPQAPRNLKPSERLQTFCMGSVLKWFNWNETSNHKGNQQEDTSLPRDNRQDKTSDHEGDKQEITSLPVDNGQDKTVDREGIKQKKTSLSRDNRQNKTVDREGIKQEKTSLSRDNEQDKSVDREGIKQEKTSLSRGNGQDKTVDREGIKQEKTSLSRGNGQDKTVDREGIKQEKTSLSRDNGQDKTADREGIEQENTSLPRDNGQDKTADREGIEQENTSLPGVIGQDKASSSDVEKRVTTPSHEDQKTEKSSCSLGEKKIAQKTTRPSCRKRRRTSSKEGEKRLLNNSKYSRISTQITPRRDESRFESYYHDGYCGEAAGYDHYLASYHPTSYLSFSSDKDSMPNYGDM